MICAVTRTSYLTVARDGWAEIEVERSRFRGTVARVGDEQEARSVVETLRRQHWDARHHCSAFVVGPERTLEQASDDGEPAGTAGPPILAQLPPETFRVIVTGDQVEFGKPHPEPYLTAAAALGVRPEDCVAIEDSNTGAKSAVAAGCLVLCVPHHVPILEGERRVFRDSLAEMTTADLADLLGATER